MKSKNKIWTKDDFSEIRKKIEEWKYCIFDYDVEYNCHIDFYFNKLKITRKETVNYSSNKETLYEGYKILEDILNSLEKILKENTNPNETIEFKLNDNKIAFSITIKGKEYSILIKLKIKAGGKRYEKQK
jgi:hypothetical protein